MVQGEGAGLDGGAGYRDGMLHPRDVIGPHDDPAELGLGGIRAEKDVLDELEAFAVLVVVLQDADEVGDGLLGGRVGGEDVVELEGKVDLGLGKRVAPYAGGPGGPLIGGIDGREAVQPHAPPLRLGRSGVRSRRGVGVWKVCVRSRGVRRDGRACI